MQTGIIWNAAAYLAFVAIIIGVFSERYRNWFITVGAFVLMFYARFFLHNQLFASLQALIVISGCLQLLGVPKRFSIGLLILLTAGSYLNLALNCAINNIWAFIGSLGLLGIAFGLIILPKRFGFRVMAIGGVFLIIYAHTVSAWGFFFFNIFFIFANIVSWQKNSEKRKI